MQDIYEGIVVDDLPEVYREVAHVIGVRNAILLSEHLGGTSYYFPKLDWFLRARRNMLIIKEFDGRNHRALARKFGITEQRVRRIVNAKGAHD